MGGRVASRAQVNQALVGEQQGKLQAWWRRAELGQRDQVGPPAAELPGDGVDAAPTARADVPGDDAHG